MYAQLVHFPGPRSAELVAASDRAATERMIPALSADDEVRDALVATFVLRSPDGGDIVLVVTETEQALQRGNQLIMHTPLLADEDPALLPGPAEIESYRVVRASGRHFAPIGGRS
jgi:hypothetical protein